MIRGASLLKKILSGTADHTLIAVSCTVLKAGLPARHEMSKSSATAPADLDKGKGEVGHPFTKIHTVP